MEGQDPLANVKLHEIKLDQQEDCKKLTAKINGGQFKVEGLNQADFDETYLKFALHVRFSSKKPK